MPRDHKNTVSAGDRDGPGWTHCAGLKQDLVKQGLKIKLTLRLFSTICENTGFTLINTVYYRHVLYTVTLMSCPT